MSTDYVTEISPNSTVVMIWGCPCTKDYRHSLRFNSVDDQVNYFINGNSGDKVGNKINTTLKRLSFDKVNYVRVNRNTIKLSVKQNETVWYNAEKLMTCNYMAFKNNSFGDKWFYAFVDTVRYINNNTVEVEYTLDVLQTWWFDLKFGECYVERETPIADAYEEMLVPEDIPTGDEVVYDTKEIVSVDPRIKSLGKDNWLGETETYEYLWGNGTPNKWYTGLYGDPDSISKVSGVSFDTVNIEMEVQKYGYCSGVKYNKVINIAFGINFKDQEHEDTKTMNGTLGQYLNRFGKTQSPYICVCSVPVLTDYNVDNEFYSQVSGWYSEIPNPDFTNILVGYFRVLGWKINVLPTPTIATFLWFNRVIQGIVSAGGTIYSCWEEPVFSFRARNGDSTFKSFKYVLPNSGFKNVTRLSDLTYDGYTPFNKKLYTYPYQYIQLINNNDDSKTFKPQLFYNFDPNGDILTIEFNLKYNDGVKFVMGAYPRGYKGVGGRYEEMILTGEYPTIAWTEDSFTKWETQYGLQFRLGVISKGVGNVERGVSQGLGVGVTELGKQVLNDIGTYYSRKNAYDDVNGSVGNIFLNYQENKYLTLYHKGITEDNARCIDNYFTVFGYAVKKYKVPYVCQYNDDGYTFDSIINTKFSIRKRFNYIKCNDTNIDTVEGNYVNANDIDSIERIFNNGITMWNVESEGNNYYTLNYNNYTDENEKVFTENNVTT